MKPTTNIFSKTRLKFEEMWNDATNYIRQTYKSRGQVFTTASPFSQLLQVILHMGRMIMFYIEDSITELNIKTANRPASIKGLATLTGHDPFRGLSARGVIRLSFNPDLSPSSSTSVVIPNYTKLQNLANGLVYTMMMPSESLRMDYSMTTYSDVNVVQGEFETQQVTGNGVPLQSYNFAIKGASSADEYLTRVYVDGEEWKTVESIRDMTPNEKACIIRTGISGGLDVFFGNKHNGMVPRKGSTIQIEYLKSSGVAGNVDAGVMNSTKGWKFLTRGNSSKGESVDLDKTISIICLTDIMMGSNPEDINLTRLVAPNTSRSMVLANKANYEYFLHKLNMFSVVDVIKGVNTMDDTRALHKYESVRAEYYKDKENYIYALNKYGSESEITKGFGEKLKSTTSKLEYAGKVLKNTKLDDNTVYLFLVPDIKKRINKFQNYFTCSEDAFILNQEEQIAILELIERSGNRVLTVENRILKPLLPRFAINISIRIWVGANADGIYNEIMKKLSDYFINNKRRDRIPVSDITKIVEEIDGVDSVTVSFDADKENIHIFKTHYGIDEWGDVVLDRTVNDFFGNPIDIRDVYPLFRGGFVSENGREYSGVQERERLSAVNLNIVGTTSRNAIHMKTGNIINRI